MRILLADDKPEIRSALRLLLQQEADLVIAAEATNAKQLLEQVLLMCPEIILLDWELPGARLVHLLPILHSVCADTRIVAMSGRIESGQAAVKAGADAFISKGDPPERVLATLRNVAGAK